MQVERLRLLHIVLYDTGMLAESTPEKCCASAHGAEKKDLRRRAESHLSANSDGMQAGETQKTY